MLALPLLALVILLLSSPIRAQLCGHAPYEWQRLSCPVATSTLAQTLCGADWCALLRVQPEQMRLPENLAWLLGARTFVAAQLNRRQLGWRTPDPINASLLALGDSLETACLNLSQWNAAGALAPVLAQLYQFNHDPALLCAARAPPAYVFAYVEQPDVLLLRQWPPPEEGGNGTGAVQRWTITGAVQNGNFWLTTACVLLLMAATLMCLKLIVYRSERRHFWWCQQNGVHGAGDDDEEELRGLDADHEDSHITELMELADQDSSSSEQQQQQRSTGLQKTKTQ